MVTDEGGGEVGISICAKKVVFLGKRGMHDICKKYARGYALRLSGDLLGYRRPVSAAPY